MSRLGIMKVPWLGMVGKRLLALAVVLLVEICVLLRRIDLQHRSMLKLTTNGKHGLTK